MSSKKKYNEQLKNEEEIEKKKNNKYCYWHYCYYNCINYVRNWCEETKSYIGKSYILCKKTFDVS